MTQEEMQNAQWEMIESCIYRCVDTGKYHFVCETEMFDETPYDSVSECRASLSAYAAQL